MDNSETVFHNIEEIPLPYRNIFNEYPCFNVIQSKVLNDILYTDNSVVVSSPTGSGKTVIFELAIVRLLMQCEKLDISENLKIVYISPIKSLCQERLVDWHKKFSGFGLNCGSFTGDSDNVDFQQLTNHNMIISTPEKWDSLTRKWRDNEKIVKVVKLFLIDEVHLLNEENRGSTLEVIVSRMKTVENSVGFNADAEDFYNQKIRFIALSATVPNVEDIAEWIGKPPNIKYYRFSEEMRPVKLKKIVLGYSYNPKTTSPFKFDISLNYKLQLLIMQYSEGKPTLIFCSTRKSVEMTANHIVKTLKIQLNKEQIQKLLDVANLITDAKAKTTVKHGIGYHHAGMIPETRHAIENLFRRGELPVLVTTSTLAMGVNLPAHLVIIKSTKCYDNCGFRDYTETAIHQMIGRAGRPQFDTSATALILTTKDDKLKFEKMVGCGQKIESNLHRHLTEHLNAEVVLRTITDLDVAMQWLASTFLYIRARKNPHHYGLNVGLSKDQIDRKLLEMCQIDLNKLVRAGMLTMDQNIIITPTTTGQIMAKYYIAFETMKLFTQISGTEILIQILALISKCHEFSEMRLRVNDKKTLNLLNKNSNKNTIRFPLNGKIKTWDMKVNCIIQAVLGNLDILDHSILSESFTIMRNGHRIAKGLIEYLGTRRPNCYSALLNTIILCKCFRTKLWENSSYVSKQLTGIGSVMSQQLVNAGKTTFRKILESNPRDLELIIKRKPPMGSALIEEVQHIPIYEMSLEKASNQKQLKLTIHLVNAEYLQQKSTANVQSVMTLLVGNNMNEILVYEKYQHSYMLENNTLLKYININTEYLEEVNAHFISDDWVGIDCNSVVMFQPSKENSKKDIDKKNDNKNPTYIQMFLDMYMKTKKKASVKVLSKKEKSASKLALEKVNKDVLKAKKLENNCRALSNASERKEGISNSDKRKKGKKYTIATTNQNLMELRNTTDLENGGHIISHNENDKLTEEINKEASMNDFNDASNTSSTSLFSNELGTKTFTDYVDKIEGEIKKEMGNITCEDNKKENMLENYDLEESARQQKNHNDQTEVEENINNTATSKHFIDFNEKISKNLPAFHISQKYMTDEYVTDIDSSKSAKLKSKRKKDDFHVPMIYGNFLSKEQAKKRQKLGEFKFSNKKKFSHQPASDAANLPDSTEDKKVYTITEMLEPISKYKQTSGRNEETESEGSLLNVEVTSKNDRNKEKSISWRSPLVFSPAVKFSPKLSFQNVPISRDDIETDGQNETSHFNLITSISQTFFDNFENGVMQQRSKPQNKKITNETFDTSCSSKSAAISSIKLQRTPQQRTININIRNRGTKFPLRDKDYKESSDKNKGREDSNDDPFDICATHFLDSMGLTKSNQTPKRSIKHESSPAADYYSQLLSHPIHSQKQKTEIGSQKELSNETNNVNRSKENLPNAFDYSESAENLSQVCSQTPKGKNKPETKLQTSSYSSQRTYPHREPFTNVTVNSREFNSPRNYILSQNKPIAYGGTFKEHSQLNLDKTLDYPINDPFPDARSSKSFVERNVNTYVGENFTSRNRQLTDFPYEMQTFHDNRCSFSSDYPQNDTENFTFYNRGNYNSPQHPRMNETITSNNYQDYCSDRYIKYRQVNPRKSYGSICCDNESLPRPICGNHSHGNRLPFMPNDVNYSRLLDDSFVGHFQSGEGLAQSSRYFEQSNPTNTAISRYNLIPRSQNSDQEILQISKPRYRFKAGKAEQQKNLQNFPSRNSSEDIKHENSFSSFQLNNHSQRGSMNDALTKRVDQKHENSFSNFQLDNNPQSGSMNDILTNRVDQENLSNKSMPYQQSYERVNDENITRNTDGSFYQRVSKRDSLHPMATQNFMQYQHNFQNNHPPEIFSYNDRIPHENVPDNSVSHKKSLGGKINERMVKILNRSLSFEEKPRLIEEDVNLLQGEELNGRVYRMHPNMNNSFIVRGSDYPQEWDCHQNINYSKKFGQIPNCFRNNNVPVSATWQHPHNYFVASNNDFDAFPSNNDKEYVMNKFLYSLNE